jgi:predicted regulator of Ras-like GTPase activity (Roadblock/LC7/MglB family)
LNFRAVLEDILERVEGALAITLIGLDGIPIDSVNPGRLPLEGLSAEFTSIVKGLNVSNTELETGEVRQLAIATDRFVTFLSSVTSEYFILMILSADGNYGRARFELLRAKTRLQDELS